MPLLGVSLTLLVIFMLDPGRPHHWVGADLALASTPTQWPKANREDALRITVARDGLIFFRNARVAAEDVPGLIRDAVKHGAERRICLSVDPREKYFDVETTVAHQIRDAHVADVVFMTEREQRAGS
jgi:biopolymer transport protein ExbD